MNNSYKTVTVKIRYNTAGIRYQMLFNIQEAQFVHIIMHSAQLTVRPAVVIQCMHDSSSRHVQLHVICTAKILREL